MKRALAFARAFAQAMPLNVDLDYLEKLLCGDVEGKSPTFSTEGTTGFPKGATLSHRNILNNGLVGEGIGLTASDVVCVPVPFYHCFGMVMGNLACTSHACTIVIPAEAFDPSE